IASEGQVLVKFGQVVAKHCQDKRCCLELLSATEQTQTISRQLGIVARVKAVTAESKSSSELLVSNAQRLLQGAEEVLRAAEAASITGLQQPLPDPEEEEVAAFCMQWRAELQWHRAREAQSSQRDELGLRRTRAGAEPTLTAMVQTQTPPARHPGPVKGHKMMGSTL
ncbi:VINC protein, partial [Oreotrochilus melanogaster]|nr:VINC protein [Oreotrochilus melanogaster]